MKIFDLPIWQMPKRVIVCVFDRVKSLFVKNKKKPKGRPRKKK